MPEMHTDRDLSTTATTPGLTLGTRGAAGPSAPSLREWAQGDKQAKKGSSQPESAQLHLSCSAEKQGK